MNTKLLSELSAERVAKFGHTLEGWTPNDWLTAVTGELGELANLLKKLHRGDTVDKRTGRPISKKDLADEIADVVIYMELLSQRLGIDMGDAVVSKFNEVSAERGFDKLLY